MSFQKISLIWHKEMKSLFRDKKALLTIFLPILIYPIIIAFFGGVSFIVQSNLEEHVSTVAVADTVNQEFVTLLREDERIDVVALSSESYLEDINEGRVDAAIFMKMDDGMESYEIGYNSTIESSERAVNRIRGNYRTYEEKVKEQRLEAAGIDKRIKDIVSIEMMEVSADGDAASRIISMLLGILVPFIIMIYSIVGVYTISSDLSAGEKERETLETIFSVPIKRFEIIIGKLFACVSVGLLSGFVNIASIFPFLYIIANAISDLNVSLSFNLFLFLMLMLLPVMIMMSAFFIGLGLFAKTYQEAQTYGSILLILFMFPCYIGLIPDIELTTLTSLIPITNTILVMKEAFLGDYNIISIGSILFINVSISIIAVMVMAKLFQSDWVIFRSEKG